MAELIDETELLDDVELPDEGEALGEVHHIATPPRSAGDMMAKLPDAVRGIGSKAVGSAKSSESALPNATLAL